jgi:hypothetical protein
MKMGSRVCFLFGASFHSQAKLEICSSRPLRLNQTYLGVLQKPIMFVIAANFAAGQRRK